jgi:hypothetical protein
MTRCILLAALVLLPYPIPAQQPVASTHLTIYNKDFAVARTIVPLDLHAGLNEILTTNVTSQLEPDSVVLRDPIGHRLFRIEEQNYDAGVINQAWLLQKYEGKSLDFQTYGMQVIETTTGERRTLPATTVSGRILRAGNDPLIEVNGQLQFQLPGMPIFPADTEGLLLKPTLRWKIAAEQPAQFPAELDYITHGMTWEATYNVVLPENSDTTGPEAADLVGWVTLKNDSGTDFPDASIQLMAGDVAKLRNATGTGNVGRLPAAMSMNQSVAVEVTQKAFDDFHLYDLHRTLSLRNQETKQVQFLEAANVTVQRSYQFDGNDLLVQNFFPGYYNNQQAFGLSGNTRVAVREEIRNTVANHLGMPLPAGRLRLYRRETAGQMQFVGEGMVPHTPPEQHFEIVSGDAFDLTAARRQTDFHVDQAAHTIDETFEIKLFNQKPQPVTIHAVEHMNRCENWEISQKTVDFTKRDSATVDFPVLVPSKGESTLTYTVHYTW